jgi:hypothetical protein
VADQTVPADVRDAAWQAYLAEDAVTAAIDAAIRVTFGRTVARSSDARERILARHARRPDGKCVMCRWADGSVAQWPCPDYLDAQLLVPSSGDFAAGVAAGRAQAAADIRAHPGPDPSPANPTWWAGYTEALSDCARLAEGPAAEESP